MFIASFNFYKALSLARSRRIAACISGYFHPDTRVLDFGCGNFYTAKALLDLQPSLHIVGLDVIRDQNLELDDDGGLEFQAYDGRTIPFDTGTFDTVIAASVLHHTQDPEHFLDEFVRVLKSGGNVVVVEEMYVNALDRFWISWQDWCLNKMKKGVPVPLQFRSHAHYRSEFERRRLRILAETYVRPGFPFQHHYVFNLEVSK
jgi:ubiquinone/menaquinone biosynthesis C-methylase UbiE